MAAEDGGKPPTHPRRRTPDHPPYAVVSHLFPHMIAAAIQTSSEEGGSTVEAISRYIRSHYDDLPDGHDNLVPYYLSKLTAQGEFVMPEPGRFLVAACAGAKPDPGSRPYRAHPSPPSKPADEKDDDRGTAESPPAVGRDSDSSIENQNGEGSTKAHPAESMLECSDEGNKESLEYVLGLPWEGPPVAATAIATANEGDGSDPVPKRGGRALKRKAASIGDSETEGLDQLKDGNDGKGPDDEPEPKRRGRPPKKKPVLIDNSGVGSETGGEREHEHVADGKGQEQPETKRRGRPPKKKPVLIDNAGVGSETAGEGQEKHGADGKGLDEPEPKRRGRPPKKKPVLIDNSGVGSETEGEGEHEHGKGLEQPETKRRGRPPKKKLVLIDNAGVGSKTKGEDQDEPEPEPAPAPAEEARKDGPASVPKRRGRPPKVARDPQN